MEVIDVINKLEYKSKSLTYFTFKRYEFGSASSLFNREMLAALSEDLMIDIAHKVLSGEVDEKGMYNYFATSFRNKCQDIYSSQHKTIKRGKDIDFSSDPMDFQNAKIEDPNSPELDYMKKEEFKKTLYFLKEVDKVNLTYYSKIIKLMLEGLKRSDIEALLPIDIKELEKQKQQAFTLIRNNKDLNLRELQSDLGHVDSFKFYTHGGSIDPQTKIDHSLVSEINIKSGEVSLDVIFSIKKNLFSKPDYISKNILKFTSKSHDLDKIHKDLDNIKKQEETIDFITQQEILIRSEQKKINKKSA